MADVLGRKFDWPPERVAEARHQIEQFAQKVEPSETFDAVAADPADNKILECAVAGKADYLVSGDKHLLSLEDLRGMPIVKVADFLDMHAQPGP